MSALSWYDNSIIEKLRTITGDNRISIVSPSDLFRYIANLKSDEIQFPLISLSRLGYTLNSTTRSPLSSQGIRVSSGLNSGEKKAKEIQVVPIQIEYQLDILTRKRNDNDEIVDEIIFYFINNPTLQVNLGRGIDSLHVFNVFFNNEVADNSDLESHRRNGEYFRSTMRPYVPDAYLWKMTDKYDKSIGTIQYRSTENLNNNPEEDYEISNIDINKGE